MDVEGSITPENYLGEKEIMDIVRQLPTGYSKVFQMAVIEGYSHKEIAEKDGDRTPQFIVATGKSQSNADENDQQTYAGSRYNHLH